MTVADVAGLIAALAFVLLVGFLAVPLLKLGRVFDETRDSVRELTEHSMPILDEASSTIAEANVQLGKVDVITTSAAQVSENISALAGLYSSVLGSPLIKVASFAYGVQHAGVRAFARLRGRSADDVPQSPAPDLRADPVPDSDRAARSARTETNRGRGRHSGGAL